MRSIKSLLTASMFLLGTIGILAQDSPVSAGGDATGTGGTVSYSVGQVNYITVQSGEGTITQGVQQPYEIFTIGIDDPGILLIANAYPNPTNDLLTLRIENIPFEGMHFTLYDLEGRAIRKGEIVDLETSISMQLFAESVYFLKVARTDKELKTFKIIKSQ